jgi:hypothetical protein
MSRAGGYHSSFRLKQLYELCDDKFDMYWIKYSDSPTHRGGMVIVSGYVLDREGHSIKDFGFWCCEDSPQDVMQRIKVFFEEYTNKISQYT